MTTADLTFDPLTGSLGLEARLAAEADAMTAEAMAAPLPEPLIRRQATELVENSPAEYLAVLAPLWTRYVACQTVTEAEVAARVDQLAAEYREAVFGPLETWRTTGRPSATTAPAWAAA